MDPTFWLAAITVAVAIQFLGFVILLKTNYKRCNSNQIVVNFGKTRQGQAAKTIHGGAEERKRTGVIPTAINDARPLVCPTRQPCQFRLRERAVAVRVIL